MRRPATDIGIQYTISTGRHRQLLGSPHRDAAAPLRRGLQRDEQPADDQQIVPPLDLGFLGAPGCSAHTNANLTSLAFPVSVGSGSLSISVPASPGLIGVAFTSQSIGFTPNNLLGLSTSNGLLWTIGS